MKHRLLAPAAAGAALLGSFAFAAPALAAPAPAAVTAASSTSTTQALATAPITQAIPGLGTFTGTFTPTGFTTQNGQLVVSGLLNGTLTNAAGVVTQTVSNLALTNVPVTGASTASGCNVLNLQLGPLNLNLLGLNVALNQVNLNITAQPGPGNLLGNLLCSVTHLLDGPGTGGLATLLNHLLGL